MLPVIRIHAGSKNQTKQLDDLLFSKAGKTFTKHRHTNSAQVDHGQQPIGHEEKKVFKFQLDPSFRNDMMKKRMTSKLSLKDIVEENKKEPNETGISGAMRYLQDKRQSLDIMKIAADKDEKEDVKPKVNCIRTRGLGTTMMDNLPHKQELFGLIDHQKTLNLNKLKERKTGKDEDLGNSKIQNESRAARFNKAMERSKALKIDNKLLNEEIRRGSINLVRKAEGGVKHDVIEEEEGLLEGDQDRDKTAVMIGSELNTSKSKRGFSFDNFFWKKNNSLVMTDNQGNSKQNSRHQGTIDQRKQRSQSREVHEVKTQSYYMAALKYNFKKKTVGPLAMIYREHFIQTIGAMKYLASKDVNMYQYPDVDFVKGKLKAKNSSSLSFLTRTFTSENISSNRLLKRTGSTYRRL